MTVGSGKTRHGAASVPLNERALETLNLRAADVADRRAARYAFPSEKIRTGLASQVGCLRASRYGGRGLGTARRWSGRSSATRRLRTSRRRRTSVSERVGGVDGTRTLGSVIS